MNQVHISFVVMLSCLQDAMSDRARYNMSMNNKKGNQFILLHCNNNNDCQATFGAAMRWS